jgi:hypothetical protein
MKAKAQEFIQLMENEWGEKVSKHALEMLSNKKFNKPLDIPVTEDLVHLVTKIRQEVLVIVQKEDPFSEVEHRRLSELTCARLILFNKRRSGEASRVQISSYEQAKKSKGLNTTNQELLGSLSDLEKQMAKSLLLVEIKGKRGQRVPLLIPNDSQIAISVLLAHRSSANVPDANPFLFAIPRSTSSLRGWDVLNKLSREFGCQKPESITGTKLRKYLATTVQVMNLAEHEMDWLARHLGHDIRIHREFYRMHESSVELTKISKLLYASEKGQIHLQAGAKLDDIPVPNLSELLENQSCDEDDLPVEQDSRMFRKKRIHSDSANAEEEGPSTSKKQRTQTSEKMKNSEMVAKYFSEMIKIKKVPQKQQCEAFIKEQNSSLKWKQVKDIVNAKVQALRKKDLQ